MTKRKAMQRSQKKKVHEAKRKNPYRPAVVCNARGGEKREE